MVNALALDAEGAPSPRSRPEPEPGWPPLGETAPPSGIPDLDASIGTLWDLREEFLQLVSRRWPTRDDYRVDFHNPDWSVDPLRLVVSDWRDHAMRHALICLADRTRVISAHEDSRDWLAEATNTLATDIDVVLARLPSQVRPAEETVNDLISILSLPMWVKRHELYSAWIFTRIADAVGLDRLSFLTRPGRLSFDFGGAQLATFDTVHGTAHIWTELKTRHPDPVGHGRTAGIQPDYSLSFEPVTEPDTSFLALECKQYLRSALRNPPDALADYTSGLPNAHVILAAWGPISSRATDGLAPTARARADVVQYLRPGIQAEVAAFNALVCAHVPGPPPFSRPPRDRSEARISQGRTGSRRTHIDRAGGGLGSSRST